MAVACGGGRGGDAEDDRGTLLRTYFFLNIYHHAGNALRQVEPVQLFRQMAVIGAAGEVSRTDDDERLVIGRDDFARFGADLFQVEITSNLNSGVHFRLTLRRTSGRGCALS